MKEESASTRPKIPKVREVIITTVGILVLLLIAYFVYVRFIRRASVIQPAFAEPAVAVMPIPNYMCDPEMEYLSAGMHDAVVNELGNINSLLVKSKGASNRYLDSELSLQEIAEELGVDVLVKPELICTGEQTQLRVEMIKLPEEEVIWSASYDVEFENIITMYREIAYKAANMMDVSLSPQEEEYFNTPRRIDPELYKLYEQGIFFMNKATPEAFEQGLNYMNQAIARDPSEPLPYLGLAMAYSNAGHASGAGDDASNMAREYALRALELDSTLAEAYTVLATDYLYRDWDFAATERSLLTAIELNPNIASLRYTMGWYLCLIDQWEEAEEEFKAAIQIDPLDPFCSGYLSWFYLWQGNFEDAIETALKTLDLDPNYPMALYVLGSAYAETGRLDEAIEIHEKLAEVTPILKCGLGVAYARAGRREEALAVAAELEKFDNYWYTWCVAEVYAALGDRDKTIQWIQAAYEQKHDFVPWFESNYAFKDIYDDPRFLEIMNKVNLPG